MDQLPRDIILHIYRFGTLRAASRLARTCSHLAKMINAKEILHQYLRMKKRYATVMKKEQLLSGDDAVEYVMGLYEDRKRGASGYSEYFMENNTQPPNQNSIVLFDFSAKHGRWTKHLIVAIRILFLLSNGKYLLVKILSASKISYLKFVMIGKRRMVFHLAKFSGFETEKYSTKLWVQMLPMYYE